MSKLEHAQQLRRRFVARVLRERPGSALDVGAGEGEVLRGLRRAGVRAGGVEASPERVAALASEGFAVAQATADRLPFPDASFDWVVMRHVAHHLPDPGRALAEMARVTRFGLVIAEPWRETALPEQDLGSRWDRWSKRQDRRLGRVHDDDIAPLTLRSLLPNPELWQCEVDYFQGSGFLEFERVRTSIESRFEGLAQDSDERTAGIELLREAETIGIGVNGTATLVARRIDASVGRETEELQLNDGVVVGIRLARMSDVPGIVAMLADDALGAEREDLSDGGLEAYLGAFAHIIDNPFTELVVVESEGKLQGTLQLDYLLGLSRGGGTRAQIEAVRVVSNARGTGLGTKLIEWSIERARLRGCKLVQLTTDKQRTRAHEFYERLGFVASHEGMKRTLT